jgi:hypothetical protein
MAQSKLAGEVRMASVRYPNGIVLLAACGVFDLLLAGCGSKHGTTTYTVRGIVLNKRSGAPVTNFENGLVILDSSAGPANAIVQGTIEMDGTFAVGSVIEGKSIAGVLPGDYRVRVVPLPDDASGRGNRRLIDPRFMRFETSGLRLTVDRDMTDVKIEVDLPK